MKNRNTVSLLICTAGAICLGISAYFGIRAAELENGGLGGLSETVNALVLNVLGMGLVAGYFLLVSLLPGTRKQLNRRDGLYGLIFAGLVLVRFVLVLVLVM
ncbi:MAG: hypothetical protein ACT6QS_00160 [Flavobacteriales bacterium]